VADRTATRELIGSTTFYVGQLIETDAVSLVFSSTRSIQWHGGPGGFMEVARGGIEPPTYGLSDCATFLTDRHAVRLVQTDAARSKSIRCIARTGTSSGATCRGAGCCAPARPRAAGIGSGCARRASRRAMPRRAWTSPSRAGTGSARTRQRSANPGCAPFRPCAYALCGSSTGPDFGS
jgi:hypothetical protein